MKDVRQGKDLSGQRFGRLTAVEPLRSEKGKGIIWLCVCDCGGRKEVAAALLRQGKTRSCGCIKGEARQKRIVPGQRFDRLTAVQYSHTDEKGRECWLFRCDCGKEKVIPADNARYGHAKSCGCLTSEHTAGLRRQDIAGRQYGRLTALEPTQERDGTGSVIWKCRCECGSTVYYSVNRLSKGRTLSCGCLYKESRGTTSRNRKDAVDGTLLSSLVTAKKPRNDNSSGCTGVFYDRRTDRWQAYISFRKKRYFLGSFREKEDAFRARKEAEEKLHDPVLKDHWDELSDQARKQYLAYADAVV